MTAVTCTVAPQQPPPPSLSRTALRDVLGRYASGLTVVTGLDDEGPVGFTCQSFHSVSLEPPLVSITVQRTSASYPRIRRTGSFTVNVLSGAQQAIADQFGRSGVDRWAGIRWLPTAADNPSLEGSLAWIDCEIVAEHEAGDHVIVVGRITGISPVAADDHDPLVYYRSRYRRLTAD
ncbi:flavin reductase family protein [Nocardioides sp. AX2bis]|uniref:flavin reductase family protein n=1 Tax=Nocardioides sp. AX2bis TaxID=2653157 RepID=UPI0012EF84B2|nr:flavin reductase family protein [Nocardioides sp. AX2bis]VXC25983.1 Flavin reductase [Nocardioides sp. AX2bis]